MKIVIADPSLVVRKVLTASLEEARHEVVCFADGDLALDRIRLDDQVDVLITSLQLPGMSGLDLVRSARSLFGARRALYVLVMSSSAERSTLIDALDSGADDFIGKPPAREELLARLRVADRVAGLQRELIRLATIDALTGVLNRRAFFETASIYARSGTDAVAIFDIDRFKQVNDTYGHAAGDLVLISVARAAAARCPVVGRLGGEEFGMILPGGSTNEAVAMCEAIRLDVAALRFGDVDADLAVTCSFGAGEWRPGEGVDDALKRADIALYAAKSGGRNRVVTATGAADRVSAVLATQWATPARRRVGR